MIIAREVDPKYFEEGLRIFISVAGCLPLLCDTCGDVHEQIIRIDKSTDEVKDIYCIKYDGSEVRHEDPVVEWGEI